jgi:N-acetylmuramic acid 6-phosphate etherase
MLDIEKIVTEQRNERTAHIDELSTLEMVRLINDEDKKVAYAVEETLEPIACAIDLITERMRKDGRLIYCGCGTSGRLGILDAVECPPTYSTEPELVQGIIAGGYSAVFHAVEGAEDNYEQGGLDLKEISFSARDILVGIAASGRTPYVIGAMNYAKSIGAAVISVTCCLDQKWVKSLISILRHPPVRRW